MNLYVLEEKLETLLSEFSSTAELLNVLSTIVEVTFMQHDIAHVIHECSKTVAVLEKDYE